MKNYLSKAGHAVTKAAEKVDIQKIKGAASSASHGAYKAAATAAGTARKGISKSTTAVYGFMDVNGDGQIDVEDLIVMGLRVPGIRISREEFLKGEFKKDFSQDVINDIVENNPAHAKISPEIIDKHADDVIQFERTCVSGISAALSAPGGVAMAAAVPADIAQYYGYMLRAAQKLLYLYGFPEIDMTEKGRKFDAETLNILTLCLGVMYGVAGANNALKSVARALGTGVQKQMMKQALTKGTVYPIVKSISKWFGVRMTKEVFTGFFKHAIPVVGGVIGGGLTYISFKPCCDKLKISLQDTFLSNPDGQSDGHLDETEEIDITDDVEIL